MRKRTKIALAVLIVGLIVLLAGFALADFDLTNLTTNGDMTQRQYEAEGDVTQLVVSDLNADVVITPSADGKARLTCWENEDLTYEISEENGVLRVEKHDGRQGFSLWFGIQQNVALEIELPAGVALEVSTSSGAVQLEGDPEGASSPTVSLETSDGPIAVTNVSAGTVSLNTGNDSVDVENVNADTLTVETDNGPITVSDVQAGEISLHNDNDSVNVENVDANALTIETDNGPIGLNGVRAGKIALHTENDDVRMDDVEADTLEAVTDNGEIGFSALAARESLTLQTDNGNIRGTLAGEMRDYHIESETDGDNNLPEALDGEGVFLRVVTDNGDIDVTFAG